MAIAGYLQMLFQIQGDVCPTSSVESQGDCYQGHTELWHPSTNGSITQCLPLDRWDWSPCRESWAASGSQLASGEKAQTLTLFPAACVLTSYHLNQLR